MARGRGKLSRKETNLVEHHFLGREQEQLYITIYYVKFQTKHLFVVCKKNKEISQNVYFLFYSVVNSK